MIETLIQNPATRYAILLAIFGVTVLLAIWAMPRINRRFALRSQMESFAVSGQGSAPGASLRARDNDSAWARLARSIEKSGLSLTDTRNDRVADKLKRAGFESPAAPKLFTLTRLGLMVVLPLGYVALSLTSAEPPSFLKFYFVGTALALTGRYVPNLIVQARADRRREEIVNGFPDCLDLMLVCVESGLGLEAAMDRVGREMVQSHPRVAKLLSITVLQLRAGASREEAYRKLADSSAVDEIRSFTTLLIQSDKLGTSIASTLRVYAAEMREKRRMRAEEKAHRLPVLISVPLVVFMLPTMIGVLMLPASIRFVREIFPMMTGG